jgi:hypothetical protein
MAELVAPFFPFFLSVLAVKEFSHRSPFSAKLIKMGLDGGTVATRSDILRRSSIRLADGDNTRSTRGGCISHARISEAEGEHPSTKYTVCALSSFPLDTKEGVVACRQGYLYNISAFHDYIFKEGMFNSSRCAIVDRTFDHLRDVEDVVPANISLVHVTSTEHAQPQLVLRCPATEIHANGSQKFVVIWKCGCVFSQKVLDIISKSSKLEIDCPCCGSPFDKKTDVIPIHPPRVKIEHNDTVGAMIAKERLELISNLAASESPSMRKRLAIESVKTIELIESEQQQVEVEVKTTKKMKKHLNIPHGLTVGTRAIQASHEISLATMKKVKNSSKSKSSSSREVVWRELGWERLESKSKPGCFYYRNNKLKITQWDEPRV